MALNRRWMPSPCYHSRGGSKVRLIVLHTAEGARTIESLGNFFANRANQVSSQVGADDKRGVLGEYVKPGNASWTQANFNNVAVSMELCGFAHWSRSVWLNEHRAMLDNCGDWIREEARRFGIPIVALSRSAAQGSGRGVCQHVDLGAGGGNHHDCGAGFPMDYVINRAKGGGGTAPPKPSEPTIEEALMADVFWLDWSEHSDPIPLVIPNYYSDGKARLRLGCNNACTVRVDWPDADNADRKLGYGEKAQGVAIPKGITFAVMRLREGSKVRVAATFSK